MRISDVRCPLVLKGGAGCPVDIRLARTEVKRRRPMNTMEVLTLLLVVFAAVSFLDNRYNKKK